MHNLNGYLQIINNNKIEVKGKINKRLTGNGSIYNPNVSYRLRFLEGKKTFLNFQSKSKDWILIANYDDKTLIRNLISLEISRVFGMRFTVNCKPENFIWGSSISLLFIFVTCIFLIVSK